MIPAQYFPIASIEAEQALLGAIFINNDAFGAVADVIRPEQFHEPLHRTIYDLASRQIAEGRRVTAISLGSSLPNHDIGGMKLHAYLAKLSFEATTVIGARDYALMVRDLHTSRQIAQIGDSLRNASDMAQSPQEALAQAWREIEDLRLKTEGADDHTASIGDSAQRLADKITEMRQGILAPAISTGLAEYDRAIGGGYRRGRLYIEAGRPGSGKTVKAIASARRIARAGHGVKFNSLEIDEDETAARTLAAELARSSSPIAYRDILTGQLDDDQHERVAAAAARMREWPLRFDCTGGITMAQIEARARLDKERMAKAGGSLDVVFIDYLGLVKVTDRYRGNQTIELGEAVLAAKNMAKRLDVAGVLLCQLNRGVEGRDDKRPNMADLRQSGNIEEHADCVALCYRPAYYLEKSAKFKAGDPEALAQMAEIQNTFELIIDKNRLGPTGTRKFWCDVSLNSIEDAAR